VTGGYVVRGPQSGLQGSYVFGDFVSGRVWALAAFADDGTPLAIPSRTLLADLANFQLSSFGEDAEGRLYATLLNGTLLRLDTGAPTGTTDGGDRVLAGGGDDRAFGGAGADLVDGGTGDDLLSGQEGDDELNGDAGLDTLIGGSGDDTLRGGADRDAMMGGAGHDTYQVDGALDIVSERAGEGNDRVFSRADAWTMPGHVEAGYLEGAGRLLRGSTGADQLVANSSLASTLEGLGCDDVLWGRATAAATLDGGAGNDILRSAGAADVLIGGAGDDQHVVRNAATVVREEAGGGTDTAWVEIGGWTLPDHVEIARLVADGTRLTGSAQRDVLAAIGSGTTLDGAGGNDDLWGTAGAESLLGGEGNDVLRGLGGADWLEGGGGNDTYAISDAAARVVEQAGGGQDAAFVEADGWTMGEHVEAGYLIGAARRLTGSAGANDLVANAGFGSTLDGAGGDDTLWGTALADVLRGGAGDDTLRAGGGGDRLVFDAAGWGNDLVTGFSRADGARLDLRGSGVTGFAQLALVEGTDTRIAAPDGSTIYVFLVTGFTAADFLF